MMKRRIVAMMLAFALCAAALLISPHLIFHADSECRQTACPVCEMLAQNKDSFVCLLALIACFGLLGVRGRCFPRAASENQFVPDWTPVRRKVKMQD